MQVAKTFKIVMLGAAGVGKTCIVNRYVKCTFNAKYASTDGSQDSAKIIEVTPTGASQPLKVKMSILDTAGKGQQ